MSQPKAAEGFKGVDLSDFDELTSVVEQHIEELLDPSETSIRKELIKELSSGLNISQIIDLNRILGERLSEDPKLSENASFVVVGVVQSEALRFKSFVGSIKYLEGVFGKEYLKTAGLGMEFIASGNPKSAFFGQAVSEPFVFIHLKEGSVSFSPDTYLKCLSRYPELMYAPGRHGEHNFGFPLSILIEAEKAKVLDEVKKDAETNSLRKGIHDLLTTKN